MGVRLKDVAGGRGLLTKDLAGAYNEEKSQGWTPTTKPGSLPASGVLGCPRRMALRVIGEVEPPSTGAPWLSEGQWHEREIIQTLRGLGYRLTQTGDKQGWFTLHLAGIKIRGQADGVVPELPGVLEIKTVGTDEVLAALTGPKDRWRVQTEVYMRALEMPTTLLFAKSRETGRARQWIYPRDDTLWKRIREHVSLVSTVDEPWALEVPRKWECQWCPWQDQCWGPEIETLDVAQDLRP